MLAGFFSTVIIAIILMYIGVDSPRIIRIVIYVGAGFFAMMFIAALLPVITVVPHLWGRHRERFELRPMMRVFNDELDLMAQLARTYEQYQLEYAHERVTLEATHLRSWSAVWFRPLETVGLM